LIAVVASASMAKHLIIHPQKALAWVAITPAPYLLTVTQEISAVLPATAYNICFDFPGFTG
jgi:hypothetical protein